jgi:hypothetical protein
VPSHVEENAPSLKCTVKDDRFLVFAIADDRKKILGAAIRTAL